MEVCCILDSMDAAKHSWPRSTSMSCKEFASFNRPRLTSTTLIVHGHMVLLALSPNIVTCGSSRTAEIISAGLSRLATRIDMRSVWVHLQADNASKEMKNVGMLRLVALWTCLHKIAGAEVCFLSSGHSHEDVDALFSLLRSHLEKNRELWVPEDFKTCLQSFFDCPGNRPNEPHRYVEMLSQYKDWILIWIDVCPQIFETTRTIIVHIPQALYNIFQYDSIIPTEKTTCCCFNDGDFDEPKHFVMSLPSWILRTNWLSYHFEHVKLQGIGGPGAPHSIRLERIGSSGDWQYYVLLSHRMCFASHRMMRKKTFEFVPWKLLFYSTPHLAFAGFAGLPRESVDCTFWEKKGYSPSPSDVIMRTGFTSYFVLNFESYQHFSLPGQSRTKQWMSDPAWRPAILFLPASVARRAQGDIPPGSECHWQNMTKHLHFKVY